MVPPDPPPAGTCRAVLTLHGHDYIYDEAAGLDVGAYADPAGRFSMSCVRTTRPDFPSMRVDFRRVEGWLCVIVEYGDIWLAAEDNLADYTVAIDGGAPIVVPAHYRYSRWRWQSAVWPFPHTPIEDLYGAKLLPRYDGTLPQGSAPACGYFPDYTPMALCGLTPYMPQTGGRSDLGPVTDWQAQYLCGDVAMLATVLAQGEAGGTVPWMFRDTATGAVIDPYVDYPGATIYTPPWSSPHITVPYEGGHISVVFTGPPGTVIWSGWRIQDAGAGGTGRQLTYYEFTIPAEGTVTVLGYNDSGTWEPTGDAPRLIDGNTGLDAVPGLVLAYVPDTFVPGTGITIDGAHQPACAYLPFLLTGDPYFLETLQAQTVWDMISGPRGPVEFHPVNGGSTRGWAWGLRNYMQAAKVTPEVVPSWLLPKAKFQDWLDMMASSYVANVVDDPASIRSVLRLCCDPCFDYDATPFIVGCWFDEWQEDFAILVEAWCAMLHGGDWVKINTWHVGNAIARCDGVSGWCRAVVAPYQSLVRDATDQPYYADWSAMGTANWVALGRDPNEPLDSPLELGGGQAESYSNGTRAALAASVQAGCAEAKDALAWMTGQLQPYFVTRQEYMCWKWAIA